MSLSILAPATGIDRQKVVVWFKKAEKQLIESVDNKDKARKIMDEFYEIRTLVGRLDFKNLSAHQERVVIKLMSRTLPKWVTLYIATIYTDGSDRAYVNKRLNNRRTRIIKKIASLQANQSTRQLRVATSFKLEQVAVKQLEADTSTGISFPDFTSLHGSSLYKPCSQLWSNWNSARSQSSLPAEEQYLLEQIATRYVPDALGLYGNISYHAGEESTQEASELVLHQIELLNEQVEQLLRRHSGDALTALRAHTDFIEGISQRAKPSGLTLN